MAQMDIIARMIIIHDPEISSIILRLAEHYTQNVATRITSSILAPALSDSSVDRRIVDLTARPLEVIERGIFLDELYLQINAVARFISDVRVSVIPVMLGAGGGRSVGSAENDKQKIFRSMAISNFPSNINILEKYTKELFDAVVRYDKTNSKPKPLYDQIPENTQTAHLLRA